MQTQPYNIYNVQLKHSVLKESLYIWRNRKKYNSMTKGKSVNRNRLRNDRDNRTRF